MVIDLVEIPIKKEHFSSKLTQMPERRRQSILENQKAFREWLHNTHNVYQWSAPDEVDKACEKIQ